MARYFLICVLFLSMMGFAQEFSPTVPQDKSCTGTDVFTAYVAGKFTCTTFAGGSGITTLDTLSGSTQTFSKTDDTNVTLTLTPSVADHNFALGWTGTLAKGRTLGTTVYTDQTNTWSLDGQEMDQSTNGNTILKMKRITDSSPLGNFLNFRNAADTKDIFTADTNGIFSFYGVGNGSNSINFRQNAVTTSGSGNFKSVAVALEAKYWNGTVDSTDDWFASVILGTGTSPTSTLQFSHSGSSGAPTVSATIFDATGGFRINGAAVSGKFPLGDGTNFSTSAFTMPIIAGTAGKYLRWDGTNVITSTGSASGVGSSTACTNQAVTRITLSSDSAPTSTCTTLTSSFLPATVVYNNAATTGTSAMKMNMGASTAIDSLVIPIVAGFVPTANGAIGYDSTANTYVGGVNTATKVFMMTTTAVTAAQMPALTGDCTTSAGAVATTCTKTSGVAFAASATTDTTSATNITSGTLPAAQMPALTGECTTSAGAVSVTCGAAIAHVIASGTATFTTTAVAASACQTTVSPTATGTATTDSIDWAYASAPTAATDGRLVILPYVTANKVNFMRCNDTAASVTPTAIVVNWKVLR